MVAHAKAPTDDVAGETIRTKLYDEKSAALVVPGLSHPHMVPAVRSRPALLGRIVYRRDSACGSKHTRPGAHRAVASERHEEEGHDEQDARKRPPPSVP